MKHAPPIDIVMVIVTIHLCFKGKNFDILFVTFLSSNVYIFTCGYFSSAEWIIYHFFVKFLILNKELLKSKQGEFKDGL